MTKEKREIIRLRNVSRHYPMGGSAFSRGWGLGEVGEEGGLGCWGVPCAVGDYLEGGAGVLEDGALG